jgi:hypothetical protein
MAIIEEAQNRAFSTYRAMHSTAEPSAPPRMIIDERPRQAGGSECTGLFASDLRRETVLQTFYEPPPPQTRPAAMVASPDLSILSHCNGDQSDSGYTSIHSGSGTSSHTASQVEESNTTAPHLINLQDAAVDRLPSFSDEALAMSDTLTQGPQTNTYSTDMDQFDWNDFWTIEPEDNGVQEDLCRES